MSTFKLSGSNSVRMAAPLFADINDRKLNIVVFGLGVTENRDANTWGQKIDILLFVAGGTLLTSLTLFVSVRWLHNA
jgi:hypothetical protein